MEKGVWITFSISYCNQKYQMPLAISLSGTLSTYIIVNVTKSEHNFNFIVEFYKIKKKNDILVILNFNFYQVGTCTFTKSF
jgi:hypothetical protein